MGALRKDRDGTVIRSFAERTLVNLKFIEQHHRTSDVYEVTQLINSMLGLFIFPKETFWENLKDLPLNEIPLKLSRHATPKNFKDLIRLMRNSFSHFNLELYPENEEIYAIRMFNINKQGHKTWQATITIHQLREFVIWFAKGIVDSSLLVKPIEEIVAS